MLQLVQKFLAWVNTRFPLSSTWESHATKYYAPKNFNFFYYFGSLLMLVFVLQFISGLWLTMFYTPNSQLAFDSVEYIMRDVSFGWLFRYIHSTGASAFFILMYLHMFRGLLYGSYQKPRELVWLLGMGLFILLMMEAFFGYLLPWGQMSYWAAQVITSLFSAIPYIGDTLALWVRGDYNVGNATLQRFFALHIIAVPIFFIVLIFLHIVALHKVGSNNPEGIEIKKAEGIPFHPYYTIKDSMGAVVFLILFFAVVFFFPEMRGYFLEPDNFVPANPLSTPEHIAPAWYLAPFYSMLRAIPNKLFGVITMASAIIILLFIPWLDRSPVRSIRYKGRYSKVGIGLFAISFIVLGYLGTTSVSPFLQFLARIFTAVYFIVLLAMPFYTRLEHCKVPPERVTK